MKFLKLLMVLLIFVLIPLKLDSDIGLASEMKYMELKEYKKELREYISTLEADRARMQVELESLDKKLFMLEERYARQLEEREKINQRILSLTGKVQN